MAEETNKQASTTPQEASDTQSKSNDLDQVKVMAALAYFGILFFLPLVTHPDSSFGKFHANQGLLLLLMNVIVSTVLTITVFGVILLPILFIFTLVLFVMGLMNALNLKKKRLPVIGGIDIIK